MVVTLMKWPPWPPSSSRKFEAILSVKSIVGLDSGKPCEPEKRVFFVEVLWKGQQKGIALGSLRRSTKRNSTREYVAGDNGVVGFDDEEFRNVCGFSVPKDGLLYPWEIVFTVFNGPNQWTKNKPAVFGGVSLNLADYASASDGREFSLELPLNTQRSAMESRPLLNISLTVLELRPGEEVSGSVRESRTPSPLSSRSLGTPSPAKDELLSFKVGLTKVKTFKGFLSSQKSKDLPREEDSSDCKSSITSEDGPSRDPFETDSLDDDDDDEVGTKLDEPKHNYEPLVRANRAVGPFNKDDERLVYYKEPCVGKEFSGEEAVSKRNGGGLLSWKRRKVSIKDRGEPLLKRHEDGGDDIDYDRRQLSRRSDSQDLLTLASERQSFGGDKFAVGSWERKEIVSRDGVMKLETQVFFASIDQRSESAAGESACTALVAVIADRLRLDDGEIPIRSEFDKLIRDGSSEWRGLCECGAHLEKFPDRHFDLETVLEAKIRPITVSPEKSFVGFFRPEGAEFDFLNGAMSFDGIWDEIARSCGTSDLPCIYIVSWNDHFFVLKVEREVYYIIDTLGERLFEGCKEAYVLRFDKDTVITRLPREKEKNAAEMRQKDKNSPAEESQISNEESKSERVEEEDEAVVCRGKESCKEYIKSFLAAIPIRELQADMKKKGSMELTVAHQRLQIEFHYTLPIQLGTEFPEKEEEEEEESALITVTPTEIDSS